MLLHVADPETFWDKDKAPGFARENGWFYGDGTYPAKEMFYEDAEKVFAVHPKLNVSLAHFYFLSDDLERAERIMETYPNVRFDLTPGIEMYGNFSKSPEAWNRFFRKYEDRILFGTDNGWGSMTPMKEKIDFAAANVAVIRRFLETADRFEGYGMDLCGLDLPVETLEKIYHKNFEAMAGTAPKNVDIVKALDYVEEMIGVYQNTDIDFYDRIFPQLITIRNTLNKIKSA